MYNGRVGLWEELVFSKKEKKTTQTHKGLL